MAEDIESAEDLTIRLLQRAELPQILPLIRELNPAIPEPAGARPRPCSAAQTAWRVPRAGPGPAGSRGTGGYAGPLADGIDRSLGRGSG